MPPLTANITAFDNGNAWQALCERLGGATTDAQCMSLRDFASGEELMTVTLGDANNVTYRCAYDE